MLDLERVHQVLADEPVGFHNILAHEYTKIDRGIVYQTLPPTSATWNNSPSRSLHC